MTVRIIEGVRWDKKWITPGNPYGWKKGIILRGPGSAESFARIADEAAGGFTPRPICPRRYLFGIPLWIAHRWTDLDAVFYPMAYGEGYTNQVCASCGATRKNIHSGGI